jgi:hypothetical protein
VAIHWTALGYTYPFGGPQGDDDYHYYSFAARLAADDPHMLRAYRLDVPPDRLTDPHAVVQANITFGDVWPYRGWSYAAYVLTAKLGLSFTRAALTMFVIQAALLIYGIQLLAGSLASGADDAWRWRVGGGIAAAAFLGIETLPSLIFSIPMNMAVACATAALGLLVTHRRVAATVLLVLAVVIHVVAAVLVLFVVAVWSLHAVLDARERRLPIVGRALAVAIVPIAVWTWVHHEGMTRVGDDGLIAGVALHFSKLRLDYLVREYGAFFPAVALPAAAGCVLLAVRGDRKARLLMACLAALAAAALGFVMIEVGRPDPLHHPLGRLLYFAPMLLVMSALGVMGRLAATAGGSRLAWALAILCGVAAVGNSAWQTYRIVETQFEDRAASGLGGLHARLVKLAADPELPQTAFVVPRFDFITVLGAARLYHGRFVWASQYSPERLEQAVADSRRVLYLQGPNDPAIRVKGFCEVSEERVQLGTRPRDANGRVVRLVWANRC